MKRDTSTREPAMDALQRGKLPQGSGQGLSQAQLERLRGVLEQRKHALLAQIDNEAAEAGDRGALLNEVEASPADNASVRTLNALVSEAAEHNVAQLAIIKDALARFADGSYGLCDNCGEAIGPSRLEARPEARLCIDCQTRLEKLRR
ncbi:MULTISPECIES: TraR/DksA family transcriptional regulator [unclassified Janthinobacterium]|uniref:TraR/DksA family transcriptional regulator n=1 Tax=unclassified Janthinobacterium TaxID=2610881 RepID=UPI0017CD5A3A|nr:MULTISPECIES: TraR/DksA family transcriptional regulator [unclassified Janthinobacterium]MBB5369213.1 DnaK suppressor protein [Janthinobacterium sp. K2C7]MBB5381250.1 DnaK suppressor protein [Janthinobacterium sp. K2Li3]MBB5387596.1 DnaK suppressor protein [Janthinobacterium sp. K2E3]